MVPVTAPVVSTCGVTNSITRVEALGLWTDVTDAFADPVTKETDTSLTVAVAAKFLMIAVKVSPPHCELVLGVSPSNTGTVMLLVRKGNTLLATGEEPSMILRVTAVVAEVMLGTTNRRRVLEPKDLLLVMLTALPPRLTVAPEGKLCTTIATDAPSVRYGGERYMICVGGRVNVKLNSATLFGALRG
jgi:hypothetical protein